ncbi:MAG: class I SAM-dependent methyltransferase [Hyphomicrobiales bacterium]|nr:class I SAM-dependent methyltransferase [Hyphomicrobiales bacterium]
MPEFRGHSSPLDRLLRAYCAGEMPPGIALLHLAMAAKNTEELANTLDDRGLRKSFRKNIAATRRLDELVGLASSKALEMVRRVSSTLSHEAAPRSNARAGAKAIAEAFDRAVSISPEGSVALYSLGRADLLEKSTAEIVDYMRAHGLVGPKRALLDIGCGIGRFELALASQVGRIIGVDISPNMIDVARQRCVGLDNVDFRLTKGARLPRLPKGSLDCVFAIDSFPYVVLAGSTLPGIYVKEIAHLLKSLGELLIVNFSYRADPGVDARDVKELAGLNGLEILRIDERPFHLWDGRVFHLRKAR